MKERLEEARQQAITKAVQEMEKYFEELARGCENPFGDINYFERVTRESRKRTDEIFLRAVGEAMSCKEPERKKNALNAGAH